MENKVESKSTLLCDLIECSLVISIFINVVVYVMCSGDESFISFINESYKYAFWIEYIMIWLILFKYIILKKVKKINFLKFNENRNHNFIVLNIWIVLLFATCFVSNILLMKFYKINIMMFSLQNSTLEIPKWIILLIIFLSVVYCIAAMITEEKKCRQWKERKLYEKE